METLVGTLSKAGSTHQVEGGFLGLPSMNMPGSEAAILKGITVKFETTEYGLGFLAGDRTFAP
ncbi:hypothetical protein [Arthrobacter cavernae]|uniref:Uncharacterized protein n=1 Tax=Arthrobacter cavernae TaxID=2817681 RepID=A0A939HKT4_9MICC|nr:hypothetical protein [Arthrobacter cavernae]MBO1269857.1 hypothetical protein [Arthrobacter cavernae]